MEVQQVATPTATLAGHWAELAATVRPRVASRFRGLATDSVSLRHSKRVRVGVSCAGNLPGHLAALRRFI